MHPRYERLCQEMIALTCYPGPHTADSLARRMFRNKQQIQSDLRWWQGILKVSGLTLSVGRQITVEGPEWTIRGFVMSMLFSFSSAAVRRRILPSLFGSIEPYDRQFLERCIAEMQRDLGFEFSSNAQWQFGVYLCIMVTRLRLGHGLMAWRGADGSTPFFAYLKKRLERHFSLTVSDAEMGLLSDMAHCCHLAMESGRYEAPTSRASAPARSPTTSKRPSRKRSARPCPRMYASPWPFCSRAAWARRTCGLVAANPNEESVKYEAMDGACLLSSVLCEVPSLVEADLFSPDYARIVLVLLDYLDQVGALRCYRVGLVVNCGIDLALWGAHRIEKLTSRLEVTDVLTENEVLAAASRPNSTLLERFDFLVSFEPMDVDFPCVTISPASAAPISITSSPPCRFGDGARRFTRRGSGASARRPLAREHVRLAARASYGRRPYRHVPRALRMARLDSVGGEGSHARVRLVRVGRLQDGHPHLPPGGGRSGRVRPMHDGRRSCGGRPPSGATHAAHARGSSGMVETMP